MDFDQYATLKFQVGSVFSPGSPINERDLFLGRSKQISQILEVIYQKGYHAIMYGERGVGKTSLSNVLASFLTSLELSPAFLRTNCDLSDTYTSIWKKILQGITMPTIRQRIGFTSDEIKETQNLINTLPEIYTPNIVNQVIEWLSKSNKLILIFDEFDRLKSQEITTLMADTIKLLSDSGSNATILIIGVADSIDELIHDHNSIERALVQIQMPRMISDEIKLIVNSGLSRLNMTIESDALEEITSLSQGLPYITHLLALHSVKAALDSKNLTVSLQHIEKGIHHALEQWQQSTKSTYYDAIKSQQPGNIFKEVLLACALANVDEMGYFKASAVRVPLRIITGKNYDISNYSKHLQEFCKEKRGNLLQTIGEERRRRYRFTSPMMRPFITMKGFSDKTLTNESFKKINQSRTENDNDTEDDKS